MIRCKFSSLPDKNRNHNSKNKIEVLARSKEPNKRQNKNSKNRGHNSNILEDLDAPQKDTALKSQSCSMTLDAMK